MPACRIDGAWRRRELAGALDGPRSLRLCGAFGKHVTRAGACAMWSCSAKARACGSPGGSSAQGSGGLWGGCGDAPHARRTHLAWLYLARCVAKRGSHSPVLDRASICARCRDGNIWTTRRLSAKFWPTSLTLHSRGALAQTPDPRSDGPRERRVRLSHGARGAPQATFTAGDTVKVQGRRERRSSVVHVASRRRSLRWCARRRDAAGGWWLSGTGRRAPSCWFCG